MDLGDTLKQVGNAAEVGKVLAATTIRVKAVRGQPAKVDVSWPAEISAWYRFRWN
jgi:hypothetical protein